MSEVEGTTPDESEGDAKAVEPKKAVTFSEFLKECPPGSRARIADLMTQERLSSGSLAWRVSTPSLRLHCASDHCKGERFFRYIAGGKEINPNTGALLTYLTYHCSDCRNESKTFALHLRNVWGNPDGLAFKYGENPPYGPVTPTRLLSMLGNNKDLFMKGRRCESQSLGIGAFVYYRRVVESQRSAIIGEIIRVAKQLGADQDILKTLEVAQQETQFSRSIDLIRDAIPESLRIQGHNPLTLLHDNLSTGLHAKSDEECLEVAQAIRVVLAELAERLSTALKDQAELNRAVSKLLDKQKPKDGTS